MFKKIITPILGAGFACIVLPSSSLAQDASSLRVPLESQVLITAERIPQPKREVATAVTVIDAKEIASRQQQSVADVLRGVPGLDVVQSGGAGGNIAIFMRGANSEHTLVYIDGIEANDPITATRTFDFANLSVDNIERIEIVRGPQSVLYGSDAIGGVILITTKKGRGTFAGSVSVEGGSYGTYLERASASGGDQSINYSLGVSQKNSDGYSAAAKRDGNTEKDSYAATNVSGQVSFTPSEIFEGDLILRYTDARSELDNFGGVGGDDVNRVLYDNQLLTRAQGVATLFGGKLIQTYGISFVDQWFDDNNGFDDTHPMDSVESSYNGKTVKLDLQNVVKVTESVNAVVGFENKSEKGSSSYISESSFGPYVDILDDRSVTTNGYYLQGKWSYDDVLIASAGGRIDDHSKFGTHSTWKAGPTLLLGDTKVSGTVGSGFKAPSIYQLYSSFGNQNLEPEESIGWDLGIEHTIMADKVTVGVTYFENEFDNLITFNPATFISENIADAESSGIETYVSVELADNFRIDGSYTFTDTEDKLTGEDLLRRARNKAKVRAVLSPTDMSEIGVELLTNGKREDNDFSSFPATRTDLGGYVLVNLTGSYKVTKAVEVFGRVDNLFDKEYQEVLGYGTSGAAVFGGVRYHF